jgi:hypothetical protein
MAIPDTTYSKNATMHLELLQVLMLATVRGHKLKVELTFVGHILTEEG